MIKKCINENPAKFYCSIASFVLGLMGFILYLCTGVIRGFTEQYSVPMIVIAAIGIIANIIFTVIRMDTVEMIPFMAYIISIFLFIATNANYLAAVVRGIDITAVSSSFVMTIVLFFVAAVIYLVGFAIKRKAN